MVLSAYSKAKIFDSKLINAMVNQIKNRLYEFLTPLEISMVINSISKMPVKHSISRRLNLGIKIF